MSARDRCRAALTGIGMVTAFGPSTRDTWSAVREGRSALQLLHLDGHAVLGAPVRNSSLNGFTEPIVAMAVTAAAEAVRDAGFDADDLRDVRAACTVSCSKGGLVSLYRLHRLFLESGKTPADFWGLISPSAPGEAVARALGINGAVLSYAAGCATGVHAIIAGVHLIETGRADVVIAGSTDASLVMPIMAGFDRMGALSRRYDDPERSCRPFDRDRDGFVVGEGAGVVVLESPERARRRPGRTYARITGIAWGADAGHITRMQDQGEALEVMIMRALNAAERSPGDVDYVNAHGTGTVVNDPLESAAIGRSLGPRAAEVPVSSVKGSIGHLLGAAGSVEVGLTALALRDGVAPPNVNLFEPDPQCNLNYVRGRAVEHPMNVALKIGAGFGGHIGIVLLERGDRSA